MQAPSHPRPYAEALVCQVPIKRPARGRQVAGRKAERFI